MKKFLSLILISSLLLVGGFEAKSQLSTFPFTTNGLATGGYSRDTLGASETGLVKMTFARKYDAMTVMVTALKISGTPSATITLQASNDGTEWDRINVDDSLVVTNTAGSQNKLFYVRPMTYRYIRVYAVGESGTQSWSLRASGIVYQ